jgi:nucleotide-binding universal stress UspA family protein
MKSALMGLDPTVQKSPNLNRFLELVDLYQSRGIFTRISVASIVNPSLYAVPSWVYRKLKRQYVNEAKERIQSILQKNFNLDSIYVLASDSQAKEDHVRQLTRYARRLNLDSLILASNDRSGVPNWFLGSFSETAALIASIPVLVIKPTLADSELSKSVRFVLAVDVATPPSAKAVKWVASLAKPAKAKLDIVYVVPKKRVIIDALQQRRNKEEATKVLNKLKTSFQSNGVQAQVKAIPESKSVAQSIADFAENAKAWLTITTASKRSGARKLFLGSTARKTLSLTQRPFLSLRLH